MEVIFWHTRRTNQILTIFGFLLFLGVLRSGAKKFVLYRVGMNF